MSNANAQPLPLTLLVLTHNEQHNIARCLDSVPFADEKLVVDSGSSDATCDVAVEHGARVVQQEWLGFGAQRNFASGRAAHDWILVLDADEALTPELALELQQRLPGMMSSACAGGILRRTAWYMGAPMRWYRPMVGEKIGRLYHRDRARWSDALVHESLSFEGAVECFVNPFIHFHSPSLVHRQLKVLRYSELWALQAAERGRSASPWFTPLVFVSTFLKNYLLRLAVFDGRRGIAVSYIAAAYAVYKRLRLYEMARNPDLPADSGRRAGPAQGAIVKRYLLYASERYALGIMRPLQAAIRKRGDEAAWFFDGPGADELAPDELVLRSVDEVMDFSPAAVFAPGNHLASFFPGVKVSVFHGFDSGKPGHLHVRGYFDLYCTTGPGDTAEFERKAALHRHYSVKETGWPKLDPYAGFASSRAGDKPVVLYHSTFSPSWSAAGVLFEQVRRMSATGRWRWIVCLHPKTNSDTVARYRSLVGENLEFSEDDNILDVFPRADVMVSDTSSALSEFLLWQKPVVTFKNRRPGPELIDIDDPAVLESAIERALQRPAGLMAAIREYTDAIHPDRDGRASERVLAAVDEFIAEGSDKLRKKPLNLWRNWRVRRRLAGLGR